METAYSVVTPEIEGRTWTVKQKSLPAVGLTDRLRRREGGCGQQRLVWNRRREQRTLQGRNQIQNLLGWKRLSSLPPSFISEKATVQGGEMTRQQVTESACKNHAAPLSSSSSHWGLNNVSPEGTFQS